MASLQKYFEQFHEKIRTDFDTNQTLREKRDIIVNKIKNHLKKNGRPCCDDFGQGSYAAKTGILTSGQLEYDIDVGLRFGFAETEYDAKTVRGWVFEAANDHTDTVTEKGPCIRVTYADGYHVDLVTYAVWANASRVDQYRLAHKSGKWLPADPPGLLEHIRNARKPFDDTKAGPTKTDQFRRSVRYLKRWNDVAIPTDRKDKPTGLALTLLCCNHLQPRYFVDKTSDDRTALAALARTAGNTVGRIVAKKPTPEFEDMFGRLSESEMGALKKRFTTLADTLDAAGREPDPVKACKMLQDVFGPDFPVPSPEDTAAKSKGPAIVTSSSSA